MCSISAMNKSIRNSDKKKKDKLVKEIVFTELRSLLPPSACY